MIYVCIVDRDNNYDYVVITTMQDILTCFSLLLLHICMHTCSWLYACMHVPVQCKHIAIWNFEMQDSYTTTLPNLEGLMYKALSLADRRV